MYLFSFENNAEFCNDSVLDIFSNTHRNKFQINL